MSKIGYIKLYSLIVTFTPPSSLPPSPILPSHRTYVLPWTLYPNKVPQFESGGAPTFMNWHQQLQQRQRNQQQRNQRLRQNRNQRRLRNYRNNRKLNRNQRKSTQKPNPTPGSPQLQRHWAPGLICRPYCEGSCTMRKVVALVVNTGVTSGDYRGNWLWLQCNWLLLPGNW